MDLNSLYHSALKVAELVKFPKDRVCLVADNGSMEGGRVGVEFSGAGLFAVLNDEQGDIEVIVEMGTATYIQPLDRMSGVYQNPRMAMAACGMIIAGCDLMEQLDEVMREKVHISPIPNRHTTVTVINESED